VLVTTFTILWEAGAVKHFAAGKDGTVRAGHSELTDEHIIVRYDATGVIVGYTILNVSQRVP
jgi:hypothetical protein